MTKSRDLKVESFDDLTGAKIMRAANLEAIFIAATMDYGLSSITDIGAAMNRRQKFKGA